MAVKSYSRAAETTVQSRMMTFALFLASLISGFWVVGKNHLLPWAGEVSAWIQGDDGLDIVRVICETSKLVARLVIGSCGTFGLWHIFGSWFCYGRRTKGLKDELVERT